MAYLELNLSNAYELGNFNLTTSMDGSNYKLTFKYNQREDFWYFDLSDIEDNIIRQGIKIISDFPVTRLIADDNRPPGAIYYIDTRDPPFDPSLEELGNEVVFIYVEEASVIEDGA